MPSNFKSWRINEVKAKLGRITTSTPTPFTKQVALLEELLSIRTVSLPNCRWARKYMIEKMRPLYLDVDSNRIMNEFEEKFTAAEERREKRREKRQQKAIEEYGARAAANWYPGKPGRPPKNASAGPAPKKLSVAEQKELAAKTATQTVIEKQRAIREQAARSMGIEVPSRDKKETPNDASSSPE